MPLSLDFDLGRTERKKKGGPMMRRLSPESRKPQQTSRSSPIPDQRVGRLASVPAAATDDDDNAHRHDHHDSSDDGRYGRNHQNTQGGGGSTRVRGKETRNEQGQVPQRQQRQHKVHTTSGHDEGEEPGHIHPHPHHHHGLEPSAAAAAATSHAPARRAAAIATAPLVWLLLAVSFTTGVSGPPSFSSWTQTRASVLLLSSFR